MVNERHTRRLDAAAAGRRVDAVVSEWLTGVPGLGLSRSDIRRLILAGGVWVDGRPVRRPSWVLRGGDRVVVELDRARSNRGRHAVEASRASRLGAPALLFVDQWLVAVDKPPGLSLHATADPRRPHLVAAVQALLVREGFGEAPGRLAVHHRLDRDTSGVVIFGRDPTADAALAGEFAERRVIKTYDALCARPEHLPRGSWIEDGAIGQAPCGPVGRMAVIPGGLAARTAFEVKRDLGRSALVEARPETGRKHQIRVHLATAGLPILGDHLYSPPLVARAAPRLMLHARRLALRHPVTGRRLLIESPWPVDFAAIATRVELPSGEAP